MVVVLFDGPLPMHEHTAYVLSGDASELPSPREAFDGQINGICGAAQAGCLYLLTGLHSGEVDFRVELCVSEPRLQDSWEDAVEVSFTNGGEQALLMKWAGERTFPLALPSGSYRARYCASGMDAGREKDTLLEGPPIDTYCLAFWAADPAPDRIVRQTSRYAGYWHDARAKGEW